MDTRTAELKQDIEQTRERIGETVEAIGQRASASARSLAIAGVAGFVVGGLLGRRRRNKLQQQERRARLPWRS